MKAFDLYWCVFSLGFLLLEPISLYFCQEFGHKLFVFLSHSPEVFQRAFLLFFSRSWTFVCCVTPLSALPKGFCAFRHSTTCRVSCYFQSFKRVMRHNQHRSLTQNWWACCSGSQTGLTPTFSLKSIACLNFYPDHPKCTDWLWYMFWGIYRQPNPSDSVLAAKNNKRCMGSQTPTGRPQWNTKDQPPAGSSNTVVDLSAGIQDSNQRLLSQWQRVSKWPCLMRPRRQCYGMPQRP